MHCKWKLKLRSHDYTCCCLIEVCQWRATGRWFSPGTLVSFTNKTDHHNITEILLKVTFNTTNLNQTKHNDIKIHSVFILFCKDCWISFNIWLLNINEILRKNYVIHIIFLYCQYLIIIFLINNLEIHVSKSTLLFNTITTF